MSEGQGPGAAGPVTRPGGWARMDGAPSRRWAISSFPKLAAAAPFASPPPGAQSRSTRLPSAPGIYTGQPSRRTTSTQRNKPGLGNMGSLDKDGQTKPGAAHAPRPPSGDAAPSPPWQRPDTLGVSGLRHNSHSHSPANPPYHPIINLPTDQPTPIAPTPRSECVGETCHGRTTRPPARPAFPDHTPGRRPA